MLLVLCKNFLPFSLPPFFFLFDLFLCLCHGLPHLILPYVDLCLDPQREVDPLVDVQQDGKCQEKRTDGDHDGPCARVRLRRVFWVPWRSNNATLVDEEEHET